MSRAAPDAGSRFTITLPLPADGDADGRSELPDLRGKRYLVLARSPFEAPFIRRKLGEAGADVVLMASENRKALAKGSADGGLGHRDAHLPV